MRPTLHPVTGVALGLGPSLSGAIPAHPARCNQLMAVSNNPLSRLKLTPEPAVSIKSTANFISLYILEVNPLGHLRAPYLWWEAGAAFDNLIIFSYLVV